MPNQLIKPKKKKYYPTNKAREQRRYPPAFVPQSFVPTTTNIIPKFTKDRNVAGNVQTRIHLKNARGEEMTIIQNQALLNLDSLRPHSGHWRIGTSSPYINQNKKRRN